MHFSFKNKLFRIEYQPIIFATFILAWTIYYYYSTINIPDGGAQSVLFIKPLTILLIICYPFVVVRSIQVEILSSKIDNNISKDKIDIDRGFLDYRRIVFSLSLIFYAIAITYLGYLIPSFVFVIFVCFYLGVRNFWVLLLLPTLLPTLLSIVFHFFIGVPIPIWPWSH